MKVRIYQSLALISLILLSILSSCNRETTVGRVLFKETKNKVYKDIDEEKLFASLQSTLEQEESNLKNKTFITNYYKQNGYQAILLKRFIPNSQLNLLAEKLVNSNEHGIGSDYFNAENYQKLLNTISSKEEITTLDDAYEKLAKLELATADALLNYSSALQYGIINPNKVLKSYYIKTERPDSVFMKGILTSSDLASLLDSIQPTSALYLALQKELQSSKTIDNKGKETIMVNMERSRWKQNFDASDMVYVNIPAFHLDVFKDGKSVMNMKVVVGSLGHETPVLESKIHSVQVNPVWNIPKSIAGKEILKHVQADRFYLVNSGIDVLEDGKVVEDSENIDWSAFSQDNLPYRFRQRPGDENALGKIKFLFKNNSSVYLHDTPSQAAFGKENRALSHGCVRVAEPLKLAQALFGNGDKFKKIKDEIQSDEQLEANDIALSPQLQVVLDYRTIEMRNNTLQFYSDIYGEDAILYPYLKSRI
ncbi:L,D-transpeptidase family protein [Albibacterium sp.]|uniref:L,D-transpeptidase family protein n=1 Tax=Albibacterium sp. TaxID=2952885 RepID=UPI002CDCBC36|nr:L,D-transpeptidase family protein [Albibacterium sp.]HUH20061.1 L,D-transpeptidase family protein [Albibacterium sp.]